MNTAQVKLADLAEAIAWLQDYVEGQKLDEADKAEVIELVEQLTKLVR